MQNKNIERDVYVKPPKEAECNVNILWKLNATIYSLNDAFRSCYVGIKREKVELDGIVSQSDASIFVWLNELQLNGLLCTCVDNPLFGGTQPFCK